MNKVAQRADPPSHRMLRRFPSDTLPAAVTCSFLACFNGLLVYSEGARKRKNGKGKLKHSIGTKCQERACVMSPQCSAAAGLRLAAPEGGRRAHEPEKRQLGNLARASSRESLFSACHALMTWGRGGREKA